MVSSTYAGLPMSPQQARTLVRSTARVNVWSGSIRAGKTFASSLRWFKYVQDAPPGGELLMVGRTRDSLYRNVLGPMMDPDIFGALAPQVICTQGAPTAHILGRRVHIMGASDSKAEKILRGMTLAGAYVDEVTVLAKPFFVQLLGRMSVPGAQCFITTNPDSPGHWFKKEYLDRVGAGVNDLNDWKAWFFQLDDNPSLDEAYKNSIRREFTGLFYQRFILGKWVAAAGAVFDMWDPEEHTIDPKDIPPIIKRLAVGVDYGTTNPTAGLALGIGTDNKLYFTNEYYYKPTTAEARKTDVQLTTDLKEWLETPQQQGPPLSESFTICDPAAASFRQQLFADGIMTHPANNDVLYGIRLMANLLSSGNLKISKECKHLIDEIPGYVWDQTATDDGVDKVIKDNDHCLDAARYAIATTEKLWRRALALT